jgi:hypothetical protein
MYRVRAQCAERAARMTMAVVCRLLRSAQRAARARAPLVDSFGPTPSAGSGRLPAGAAQDLAFLIGCEIGGCGDNEGGRMQPNDPRTSY